MGFEIASKRTPDGKNWAWSTFGSGQGFVANHIVAGVLSAIIIQNLDGSLEIDLSGSNGALFRYNGKDAIRIHNNSIDLFNWAKNGDFIGSLMALTRNEDDGTPNPNKPLVGLIHDADSTISIGYKTEDNIYKSYFEFDKNNVLRDETGKPIRVFQNSDFTWNKIFRVYLSSLNEKNRISVDDDGVFILFEDRYRIFITNNGLSIGEGNTNLTIKDGKIHVNGDIDFSNANVTGLPIISGGVGGD